MKASPELVDWKIGDYLNKASWEMIVFDFALTDDGFSLKSYRSRPSERESKIGGQTSELLTETIAFESYARKLRAIALTCAQPDVEYSFNYPQSCPSERESQSYA